MKLDFITPSKLDQYSNCPYCFYLSQNKVKQPYKEVFEFGTGVHAAIEKYHKEECIECENPDYQEYLNEYMDIYTPEFEVCEERFEVPLFDTGVALSFKMDLVKDGWIMDHKTSSGRWTQEQADNNRQLTAYAYAFREYFGKDPQGIRFNVFNKKVKKERLQTLDTFRTDDDFEEWKIWVREILARIEADDFEPKPHMWHIYTICPMYRV